ncbi:hypothetical protein PIB30_073665 [Stylosanthes scabra]|uniref:Transposase n=1 Tax=Stylosanthes scabra TaxID=79078 RepID=A0ABU6XNC8_9FABA|nr:hypothetical protein [Stylosanthes scabra]
MDLPRYSEAYIDGVSSFLDFAYSEGEPDSGLIQCPCYRTWINHGEWMIPMAVDEEADDEDGARDDMEGLLNNAFGEGVTAGQNKEAKKF